MVEGAVEQGVDWVKLADRLYLNAFGRVRYVVDSEKFDFNNKLEPGFGLKLRARLGAAGSAELGVAYVVEHRWESGRTADAAIFFLNWAGGWDLKRSAGANDFLAGLPGWTWGNLRFPSSAQREERDNVLAEGALEQGVDWVKLADRLYLNTFGRIRYVVDSEKFDFNNKLEPGFGVKLRAGLGGAASVELGVAYVVEYRWQSGRTADAVIIFLNWAGGWDFKRR